MKFYETHYEEYIHAVEQYNIHPEMIPIYERFPRTLSQFGNIIVYGPPGAGKYSQVLYFLKKYSPSDLKYDKKITCQTDKVEYNYHISDIHYEIDMALLGCNSKLLWHELFMQIVDIVSVKSDKIGIIVCKNFHLIHNELLEIFYSYMQHYNHSTSHIQIRFVIISEHISFIPKNIMQSCKLLSIQRPAKQKYVERITDTDDKQYREHTISTFLHRITPQPHKQCATKLNNNTTINEWSYGLKIHTDRHDARCMEHDAQGHHTRHLDIKSHSKKKVKHIFECLEPEYIMNIKETESFSLMNDGSEIPKDNFNTICNNIIQELLQYKKLSFTQFRDTIYDILVYNLDVHECLWYVVSYFIQRNIFTETEISGIMEKMYVFLKQYNNNYRPIYHLESIFFYIITIIQSKHK